MIDVAPLLSAWWRELQMIDDGLDLFDRLAPPKKPKPHGVVIMGLPASKESGNERK